MEAPGRHSKTALRQPARYLIIIGASGGNIARLFLDNREPAGEFDAATEEVTVMTRGQTPTGGADGPEWDKALQGHSTVDRVAAKVYTLDL